MTASSTNRFANHPRRRATDQRAERQGERGFAILLELLVTCAVVLILLTFAIPNLVVIRAASNQANARAQILQVARANAALALCAASVPALPCSGVANLVPAAGTIIQQGYSFTYTAGWTYTATPTQLNISGIQSYFVDATGVVRCGVNGSAPAC